MFTAKYVNSIFTVVKHAGSNWQSGQNHTFGCFLIANNQCQMRADGNVIDTFTNCGTSNTGSIQAGLEWGKSDNASQSITLPSSMTNLSTMLSGNWYTWSNFNPYGNNNHPGIVVSYNSQNNVLSFISN